MPYLVWLQCEESGVKVAIIGLVAGGYWSLCLLWSLAGQLFKGFEYLREERMELNLDELSSPPKWQSNSIFDLFGLFGRV